jgi:SAM-dependent methyltransferase
MAAPQRSSSPSATTLFDLTVSHRITAVIHAAARLGVADVLAEAGPTTVREIADRTGAHEPSLQRLLRALVTIGVCTPVGKERFGLTAVGEHLAAGATPSLKAWALFEGEMLSRSWAGLVDSIRSGKTAAELAGFVESPFELLARSPESAAIFNEAMVALTRQVIPGVLAAYDFSGIGRLIDVGGGYGELLCAILEAYPTMSGAVFDLPACAEGARTHLAASGLAGRGEFIAGDFFESVPGGADAILLKSILHDWDDDRSLTILRNCRRALAEGGLLLLVERLLPETPERDPEHVSVALSDLNMLRGAGGRERSEGEYRGLLGESGLAMTRVVPAGRFNVIEGMVASAA